jgi:glycosyltransferase involved in cell wall biosynthesis
MNDTLRVGIFLPSLEGGGAERVMCNLACELAERGLSVDLVLSQSIGPYLRDVHSRVTIVDLKAGRIISSIPKLWSYLQRAKPYCVISALSHANVIASLTHILARSSARLILSEHVALSERGIHTESIRERMLPFLIRLFYRQADLIVAVSNGVGKQLEEFGLCPRKIRVIYNPIVNDKLIGAADEDLEDSWFYPEAPPVIVGAGRLVKQKDFQTLLQAFSLVRSRRLVRLLILGDGPDRPHLVELAQRLGITADLRLAGFVHNPFKYMKRARAFVLSSQFEGFPTVLVEAMACGTPIISTDCRSGPAEILENGRWGRLVPVGDAVNLAWAIHAVLDEVAHPDVRSRASMFRVEAKTNEYLKIIELT